MELLLNSSQRSHRTIRANQWQHNYHEMLQALGKIEAVKCFIQWKRVRLIIEPSLNNASLSVWKCYQRTTEQTAVSNHCQDRRRQKLRSWVRQCGVGGDFFTTREYQRADHSAECLFLRPGKWARSSWNLDFQLASCLAQETQGRIQTSHGGSVALVYLSARCLNPESLRSG